MERNSKQGLITGITGVFLKGPLSVLIIVLAFLLGGIAIYSTPREEEPQIVVPTADISVSFPGHSAEEVEQLVTLPLEKLIWQIDGIEHVYSISRRDRSFVTARFFVGEDRERSIIKLRDKIEANRDIVPPGVKDWIIKPVEIDDVPIVTLTFFSDTVDDYALRRIAEEYKVKLEKLENISKSEVIGGRKRVINVEPDIEKISSMGISFSDILNALRQNNLASSVGKMTFNGRNNNLVVSSILENADGIRETIIASDSSPDIRLNDIAWLYSTMYGNDKDKTSDRIIRIEDIANVTDADEEEENYLTLGFGPASELYDKFNGKRLNAVTLSFSKKKGTNAVTVASKIIEEVNSIKTRLPADVNLIVTRNYGEIANDKVNSLIESMIFAVITVIVLIYFTMGWREGLVVGLAVPVSFALALFINYIAGYTINRVTLFALILSLGLVVDDPITNVDNIQRHIRMGRENAFKATLSAVQEVLPPVIMSTLTIIISFIPMFFITGMMGPYMGPMAINVPMAVTFSTLCALTFVPWLSYRLLRHYSTYEETSLSSDRKAKRVNLKAQNANVTPEWIRKSYRIIITPFLNKKIGISLLALMCFLTLGSAVLLLLKVPLKMLPYDNKDELQLIVDLPEGSTLEDTDRFTQELTQYLASVHEVKDFQTYTGINSPVDFNGLIRRYNFRREPHNADIRINLASKYSRSAQSHAIGLRLRRDITDIADRHNAKVKLVEVPPGPPVISTITAELRGGNEEDYASLISAADTLKNMLKDKDPIHIVEIDDMSEASHNRFTFAVDPEKAATSHLTASDIYNELGSALGGSVAGISHTSKERNPLFINARLPYSDRNDTERLSQLWIKNRKGEMIQLSELGAFVEEEEEQPIYHKDLERVVYVTAESAGKAPGEIILDMISRLNSTPLPDNISVNWTGEGEWEITLRVFRDLGIAFGIAMIGIYLLLTVQMKHFFMPLMVMMSIPLTIIGIAPGFYLLNLIAGGNAGGYPDPLFFTATAMIGMIALGGIVTRNSIVLIEFIQESIVSGNTLREAVIESGAVRFRPIILTALTTMLGAWPITFDPVFSGLAWSLIFGLISSTIFTMIVIPVVYFLIKNRNLSNTLR